MNKDVKGRGGGGGVLLLYFPSQELASLTANDTGISCYEKE